MTTHKICTAPQFKHIISEVGISLFCFEQAALSSPGGLYFVRWLLNQEEVKHKRSLRDGLKRWYVKRNRKGPGKQKG